MTTLLISDLHLDATRPDITRLFERFVREQALQARALFILGDLFEAWIGDDAPNAAGDAVAAALSALHAARVPCYYMHGNRDFLLGDAYARRCRMTLLADPCVIDLGGTRTLLMHGDTLCTDDAPYQAFRAQTHQPQWQRQFLGQTVEQREQFAAAARAESQRYTAGVDSAITDVNDAAMVSAMREHGVTRLIHGHTHRPAVHDLDIDGQPAQRIVLGDWYEQGSVLRIDHDGFELQSLPVS